MGTESTDTRKGFRVGELKLSEVKQLVEEGDPRVLAYTEGMAAGTRALAGSVAVSILLGPESVLQSADEAVKNAEEMLRQAESGELASVIQESIDNPPEDRIAQATERIKQVTTELAEALGITFDEDGNPVLPEGAGEPEGEEPGAGEDPASEFGRTFRFDSYQDIEDANQRLADTANAAEAIGARPSAVLEFASRAVSGATIQDLPAEDFAAWMLAVGYALAGGEITTLEQTEREVEQARRAYAEANKTEGEPTPEEDAPAS